MIALTLIFSVQLLSFRSVASSSTSQTAAEWKEWLWPVDGEGEEWPATQSEEPKVHMEAVEIIVEPVAAEPQQQEQEQEQQGPVYPETAWKARPLKALDTTFHVADDIVYDPAGPRPDQVVIVTATDGGGHNGGIENIIELTAENRKQYCAHHGYHYHFVNISQFDLEGAHPVWKKLPAIVDAFNAYPEAQWVFFLDLDAIIMSPEQDLNSLVLSHVGMRKSLDLNTELHGSERTPLGYYTDAEPDLANLDMLIAQDHNGINGGSFFLRRSKYSQWLLDMWADPFFMRMYWPGQEQEALVSALRFFTLPNRMLMLEQLHFASHHHTFREHLGIIKQRVANAFPVGDDSMAWVNGDLIVHFAGCWVDGLCQQRWADFWSRRGSV